MQLDGRFPPLCATMCLHMDVGGWGGHERRVRGRRRRMCGGRGGEMKGFLRKRVEQGWRWDGGGG